MENLDIQPSDTRSIFQRQLRRLRRIHDSLEGTEVIEGEAQLPPHLIANGRIQVEGQAFDVKTEIRTAISIRPGLQKGDDDIEFSTNIGRLPDIPLSNAIVDRLNHRLTGKFVTFRSQHGDDLDVVYTSRQPADWLNQGRICRELEKHANTQTIVSPILSSVPDSKPLGLQLQFPEIRNVAQSIVDTKLLSLQRETVKDITYDLPKGTLLMDHR